MGLADLVALAKDFGWGDNVVDGGPISGLARSVRAVVTTNLEAAVTAMLAKWDAKGLMDLGTRRRTPNRPPRARTPLTQEQLAAKRAERRASAPFVPPSGDVLPRP